MRPLNLKEALRFYFITDPDAPAVSVVKQVETAIAAGATIVEYRNKTFSSSMIEEVRAARNLCSLYRVPFIVNDNILLALAVKADGVHLGQGDESPVSARDILGEDAIIGASVSTPAELDKTYLAVSDYLGVGPVFQTSAKQDAKPVIGIDGLREMAKLSPLPVIAIGGITAGRVEQCRKNGAVGCAVMSGVARAASIDTAASEFGKACGCAPRKHKAPWKDEFGVIARLIRGWSKADKQSRIIVGPGDDAALFSRLDRPVFSTDTQRQGVHFSRDWQTLPAIGKKAVEVAFSDLAASYAVPVAVFINLSLPRDMAEDEIAGVYDGVKEALFAHNAVLGGGNVSSGPELCLDLFAVGEAMGGLIPLRSAAKVGERLYATGPLGLARAGLLCLEKQDKGFSGLVEKFVCPRARFDAARVLEQNRVACVMDISDGLAGDAAHIAAASGVSMVFSPDHFYIDPVFRQFCKAYGLCPENEILAGGEDYELLFSCDRKVFEQMRADLPGAFEVGKCLPREESLLINLPDGVRSFSHGLTAS
ncbi:MAG: thiamine-phosphate kinase [Deltaproteobacteria bacterium]|nr:thiamine-phosphate kinase [Deltaproteobacteria bacterium]